MREETGNGDSDSRFDDERGRDVDRRRIAEEVLAAVGGRDNVTGNGICMTRLRIVTEDPSLVDTEQLSAAHGVLGFVRRGDNGIEVVFGPGKVEGVHDELVTLTGVDTSELPVTELPPAGAAGPIKVHITPNALRDAAISQRDEDSAASPDAPAEIDDLASLLGGIDEEETSAEEETKAAPRSARVLVINGPNINMLGIREPDIYGHDTYQSMLQLCHDAADEAGFVECTCFQSNHEGDLIDAIQDAYGRYDGIVINPGAYTHTSIALLDAAKAVGLPMVEVHISKLDEREDFRQVSYIRAACFETVSGQGIEGYRTAIRDLAAHIGLAL